MVTPQSKKKRRTPKRRRPPWHDRFGGKPIERLFSRNDPDPNAREWAEKDAFAELFKRMRRLKEEHYRIEAVTGWRPWFDLAVALASELDPSFKTIDPKPPRTDIRAKRWAGAEGVQLINEIDCLRAEAEASGSAPTIDELIELHQREFSRYREMDSESLRSRYFDAVKYHGDQRIFTSTSRPSTKRRSK